MEFAEIYADVQVTAPEPAEPRMLRAELHAAIKGHKERGEAIPAALILLRYPRVTAHLICCSLGYMTPCNAARAVSNHKAGQPHYCEWYDDWAGKKIVNEKIPIKRNCVTEEDYEENRQQFNAVLLQVNRDAIANGIRFRHSHKGYMAEYQQARAVIENEIRGFGPQFASWF